MPLGGESKLSLLGDPMKGTPNFNRARDVQPPQNITDTWTNPPSAFQLSTEQSFLPPDMGMADTPLPWPEAPAGNGAVMPGAQTGLPDANGGEGRLQQAGISLVGAMVDRLFKPIDEDTMRAIESAISMTLRQNRQNAIGRDFWRKRDWMMFRAMKEGNPPGDDENHPLVQLGYHPPLIAKYEQQMRTTILNMLIPDASEYDFFELEADPLWQGFDGISEALTELLRRKFKQMAPHAANGFFNTLDLMMADYDDIGTCVGLCTYDMLSDPFEPGNTDGLIDGPSVQWVDVFNVFPDRDDVNTLSETFVHIWDPVIPENIERMGLVNLDKLPKPSPQFNRFMNYAFFSEAQTVQWSPGKYYQLPALNQYPRWIGLGRFPFSQVKDALRGTLGEEWADLPMEQSFGQLMQMIAPKFMPDVDPATIRIDTFFDIQCDDTSDILLKCRPYSLKLPRGKGPLIDDRLYKSPGYVWGDGLYKRCQLDERFYADLERQAITWTKFESQGVWLEYDELLDDEYREHRGDQFKVEPGMIVKGKLSNSTSATGVQPINRIQLGTQPALEMIGEKQQQIVGRMQDLTSINNDVQGQSTAKTATQSAQNLQQGLSILQGVAKSIESGMLREIVARCYVVMQQAALLSGFVPPVTVSSEEALLRTIRMSPADIMSLTYINVRMMGLLAPGNKANQLQQFLEYFQIFSQTGALDINECAKVGGKMLGFSGSGSLLYKPDPNMIMGEMQNYQNAGIPLGTAISFLPPAHQQGIGMMMQPPPGGSQPGQPPPDNQGKPGSPPPSGQQGGPPMPPNMMQSSGPGGNGPPQFAGAH